jgi:hypothetical protein
MAGDTVGVSVTNWHEMPDLTIRTEEKEPEHYAASTFALPALGPSSDPAQILQLDPLRKRALVALNGAGQVILAHSFQQAQALQKNVAQAADDGCIITAPATVTAEGTGPLWAVGIGTANLTQQSVSAFGAVTGAASGQAIATIAAANLPTGSYEVYLTTYMDGTLVTATDENNLELLVGGTQIVQLLQPGPSTGNGFVVPKGPYIVNVNGTQTISVNAIAAASVAAKYNAEITAVPLLTSSGLSVGVLQERRNANG